MPLDTHLLPPIWVYEQIRQRLPSTNQPPSEEILALWTSKPNSVKPWTTCKCRCPSSFDSPLVSQAWQKVCLLSWQWTMPFLVKLSLILSWDCWTHLHQSPRAICACNGDERTVCNRKSSACWHGNLIVPGGHIWDCVSVTLLSLNLIQEEASPGSLILHTSTAGGNKRRASVSYSSNSPELLVPHKWVWERSDALQKLQNLSCLHSKEWLSKAEIKNFGSLSEIYCPQLILRGLIQTPVFCNSECERCRCFLSAHCDLVKKVLQEIGARAN